MGGESSKICLIQRLWKEAAEALTGMIQRMWLKRGKKERKTDRKKVAETCRALIQRLWLKKGKKERKTNKKRVAVTSRGLIQRLWKEAAEALTGLIQRLWKQAMEVLLDQVGYILCHTSISLSPQLTEFILFLKIVFYRTLQIRFASMWCHWKYLNVYIFYIPLKGL